MADIKGAIRGIPPMQEGEEPANEGQKGYLRSFGYFSEKMIKGLGVSQAAYLLEQAEMIKEGGSASLDMQLNTRRKGGFGRLVFLLAFLLLAIVGVRHFSKRESDDAAIQTDPNVAEPIPGTPLKVAEITEIEKVEPEVRVDPVPEQIPESAVKPLDLALVEYPATLVTTEEIKLLNNEGKETPIAVGTPIRIAKRSELGTLTMEIEGRLFVGNESRLLGKVKLE